MTALVEISGWVVLSLLALVLVDQTQRLRAFTRPSHEPRPGNGSLSVVVTPSTNDSDTRRVIASVARNNYPGKLEILLVADSPADLEALAPLTLAEPRVRIVDVPSREQFLPAIESASNSDWLLFLSTKMDLEPGAIERIVSEATIGKDDHLVLVPRLALSSGDILLEPMLPWLLLTMPFAPSRLHLPDRTTATLAGKSSEGATSVRLTDGYDCITRPALDAPSRRRALAALAGDMVVKRIVTAAALLVLFALPLPVALLSKSFPWIVAAIVSYWLRLRVAPRTGEPIEGAILHPLSVVVTAVSLLVTSTAATAETKSMQPRN